MLTPSDWVCRQAEYHEWPQVVECWYGYLVGTQQNEIIVEQLVRPVPAFTAWGAWRDHQLEATVLLSQSLPCVHTWPIRCVLAEKQQSLLVAHQLWTELVAYFQKLGFSFLQSLIRSDLEYDIQMMKQVGMAPLTSIQHYLKSLDHVDSANHTTVLKQNASGEYSAFRRYLLSTFADTLDVPELNALASETSTGWEYQGDHLFRYLIMQENICTGVAVLEVSGGLVNLRYIGVLNEYRGRGIAQGALHQLLLIAKQMNCMQMQVRVDIRNTPALRLYKGAGFTKLEEEVLLYLPLTF